jgi:hypothetical protein
MDEEIRPIKFETKSPIMKLLAKLEFRIKADGLVLYSDEIIKDLKTSKDHFEKNKPESIYII